MNKLLASLAALVILGGCQSIPQPDGDQQPGNAAPASASAEAPAKVRDFSEESLYTLLVAELAGQRNRFDIALAGYMQQARATRDPGVAERAFRIAEYLGADQVALEAVLIWADNAPSNLDAQRAAAAQLARSGRYDESMDYMERVMHAKGDTHFDFLALAAAESDPETRAGLLQSFDRLLTKSPDNGQLLFGKALLLQQDDQPQAALQLLEKHPASEREVAPLLLRIRLLQNLSRGDEALQLLKKGIRRHPDDKRLRLTYARLLVEQGRLADAKSEFAKLVEQFPEDDELRLSMALLCLEAEDWDEATLHLQTLIERGSYADAAHFHLGRIYEERKDMQSALIEYLLVSPGSYFLPALQRRSEILLDSGRTAEASANLAKARAAYPDFALQLYLIEAESLSNHQLQERAWGVIEQALRQFPEDLNLLYTRAMLAEKRGDLAQLERDLRFIIEREPDNAMALNALGYTLADRTTRYDEARTLIERAYRLTPDDPAILDSLGWVSFRQGRLDDAERLLRQALEHLPDQEVAAHLGEVLWTRGKQKEARAIWKKALREYTESPTLRTTLQRLTGSETP